MKEKAVKEKVMRGKMPKAKVAGADIASETKASDGNKHNFLQRIILLFLSFPCLH